MEMRLVTSALCFVCSLASQVQANDQSQLTRWDRGSAMAAVRSVNVEMAVREIGDISSLSDGISTLGKLAELETRGDWPLPAREAAVYAFTKSLSSLPRDAVATEVMQHLRNYESRVLVPDEDHGAAAVPMFNVRGAAAGVENGWQRIDSAATAAALIEEDPGTLVSKFIDSDNHNQRAGFLDALQQADLGGVKAVQSIALGQLEESPGLTGIIATTALITIDHSAIRQLLVNGQGAGLSSALVNIGEKLPAFEIAELLAFAIEQAPAGNAALAIAAWWPGLSHDIATRDLMISTLADPSLGVAATLALAQSPDLQTIKALQDTAIGDSSAARRAQMALDLNRSQLINEAGQ